MAELKLQPDISEAPLQEENQLSLVGEEKKCEAFEKTEETFSRFTDFLKNSPLVGQMIIKRWINQPTKSSIRALRAVAQVLNDEQISELFSNLNKNEKEKWRQHFNGIQTGKELYAASLFISQELKRGAIAPEVVKDKDILDMLMNMSFDQSYQFLQIKSEYQKVFAHLIPAEILAKVLGKMNKEDVQELLASSVAFSLDQVADNFAGFKKFLEQFFTKFRSSPFSEQLIRIIPGFNPMKELMLYKFLASERRSEDMRVLAGQNLPSDLITKMPKEFLKLIMQEYPGSKKIILLASLDQQKREVLLSSFAEDGSAARELVDMEFDNLKSDQKAQSMIKNSKDEIWKEFVYFTREHLKKRPEFESEAQMLINSWIEELLKKIDQ